MVPDANEKYLHIYIHQQFLDPSILWGFGILKLAKVVYSKHWHYYHFGNSIGWP